MSSLERFAADSLKDYEEKNLLRSLKITENIDSVHVIREGKKLVSFAGNDYLGLARHPAVKQAAEKYSGGAGASRYITGNHPLYPVLEKKIAAFKGFADACIMGSGYLANIGAIPVLAGKGDLIIADKLVHASIIDGIKLSGADFLRFKHNDMKSLKGLLEKNRQEYRNVLIITEEIFSMDGDKAPLFEIAEIAGKCDAWIYCDAAHSLYSKEKYPAENFVLMGTFSKALGSYGGYISSGKKTIDFLKNKMRSSIFTTALPPGVIAASIAALEVVEDNQMLPVMALDRAKYFISLMSCHPPSLHCHSRAGGNPYSRGGEILAVTDRPVAMDSRLRGNDNIPGAIVPYIVGDEKKALEYAAKLEKKGFLTAAIRPPTVPKNTSRLRFSFSSAHSEDMIEGLATALNKITG